jgi:hypothetical protein
VLVIPTLICTERKKSDLVMLASFMSVGMPLNVEHEMKVAVGVTLCL